MTHSRLPFRPRRADLRPRARAFPDGAADRREGADVLARLRPEADQRQARRHRVPASARFRSAATSRWPARTPKTTRTGAPDEFLSKGKWQRFQVLVMGPVMNLLLALVVMAVVLYQGAQSAEVRDRAGGHRHVRRELGRPAKAGLKPGDRIVTVDGKPVENWDQFSIAIVAKANRQVTHRLRARRPRDRTDAGARGTGQVRDGRHRRPAADPSRRSPTSARASRRPKPGSSQGTSSSRPTASENISYDAADRVRSAAAQASR